MVILLLVISEAILEGIRHHRRRRRRPGADEGRRERHRRGVQIRVEAVLVGRRHQQYLITARRVAVAVAQHVELGQVQQVVGHVVLLAACETERSGNKGEKRKVKKAGGQGWKALRVAGKRVCMSYGMRWYEGRSKLKRRRI